MSFPWYQVVENSSDEIHQGDFIYNCPILVPPKEINLDVLVDVKVQLYNVVVLTQSCDLVNGKIEMVLVCQFIKFRDFVNSLSTEQRTKNGINSAFKKMKEGLMPSLHILNNDAKAGLDDFIVVNFKNVFGVNFQMLNQHVQTLENRVRLLPPYREQLSQAFAKFFMRVGLPQTLPDIDTKIYLNS